VVPAPTGQSVLRSIAPPKGQGGLIFVKPLDAEKFS
jgi:hypothetical protein